VFKGEQPSDGDEIRCGASEPGRGQQETGRRRQDDLAVSGSPSAALHQAGDESDTAFATDNSTPTCASDTPVTR